MINPHYYFISVLFKFDNVFITTRVVNHFPNYPIQTLVLELLVFEGRERTDPKSGLASLDFFCQNQQHFLIF